MADEGDVGKGTGRLAAVVSSVTLLLAVGAAQNNFLATRRLLMPEFERLHAELPIPTMWLVANYPAAIGYVAIALCAVWLAVTVFLRRGTVPVIINCVLLLLVIVCMILHG